jgi:hypothetical protein
MLTDYGTQISYASTRAKLLPGREFESAATKAEKMNNAAITSLLSSW